MSTRRDYQGMTGSPEGGNSPSINPEAKGGVEAGPDSPVRSPSRRRILGLGAAAVAALAATAVPDRMAKAEASSVYGESTSSSPAVHGKNTDGGAGVCGDSESGAGVHGSTSGGNPGVLGRNEGSGPGVMGQGISGHGVAGQSSSGAGLFGSSQSGIGVGGNSLSSAGVVGQSQGSTGVHGQSETGAGLFGFSRSGPAGTVGLAPASAPGVQAISGTRGDPSAPPQLDGGLALQVVGKAQFSTAGSGTVSAGASSAPVANSSVTGKSHITVTLMGDPGSDASWLPGSNTEETGSSGEAPPHLAGAVTVQWVERRPGQGFVLHLSGKAKQRTPFTYLVVEPLE
ncbi:MAG: hypothetical protein ACYC3V_20585 [Chloroflexota bacterium]